MESIPMENTDRLNLEEEKEKISSSSSGERREKRRIFFLTKSLAEVYAKQGQISMALEIYKRMLDINPSDDIEKRIDEMEGHLSTRRGIKVKEEHDP